MPTNYNTPPSIIPQYTRDSNGNIVGQQLTEHTSVNSDVNMVFMSGTPREYDGFDISNKDGVKLTRVYNPDEIYTTLQYYFCPNSNVLWVHPDIKGQELTLTYTSVGANFISSSLIATEVDGNGRVTQVLSQLLQKGQLAYDAIGTIGDVIAVINELNTQITTGQAIVNTIDTVKTQLDSIQSDFTSYKTTMDTNVSAFESNITAKENSFENTINTNNTTYQTTMDTKFNQLAITLFSQLQDSYNKIYPVGSVLFRYDNTNPSTIYGGSWTQIAQGESIVGIGTGTDQNGLSRAFNLGDNAGEYKHTQTIDELVSHNHGQVVTNGTGGTSVRNDYDSDGNGNVYPQGVSTDATGGGQAFNVTQPTYGLYIWRRLTLASSVVDTIPNLITQYVMNNIMDTVNYKDGSITTNKLADKSVTTAKASGDVINSYPFSGSATLVGLNKDAFKYVLLEGFDVKQNYYISAISKYVSGKNEIKITNKAMTEVITILSETVTSLPTGVKKYEKQVDLSRYATFVIDWDKITTVFGSGYGGTYSYQQAMLSNEVMLTKIIPVSVDDITAQINQANAVILDMTTKEQQFQTDINTAISNNSIVTTSALDDKLNSKVFLRKFAPKLTQTLYCMNYKDGDNRRTVSYDTTTLLNNLTAYKNAGIEGINISIHIGYNSDTNDLFYETNLDTIDYIIAQSNTLGIPVNLMKFHEDYAISNIFTMGETVFKNRFKAMVTEVSARYKDKVKYLGLFNEWQHFCTKNGFTYNSTTYDYTPFVIECLAIPRAYNFLTSVSCAGVSTNGWASWITVDDSVKSACDVFMINGYPPCGNKGQNITKYDCKEAWDNYNLHKVIRQVREEYGAKPIILTETGIMDYWYNFYAPSDSSLIYGVHSNGETSYRFLYGLFESLKQYTTDELLSVNWWYDVNFINYGSKLQPLVNEYLKGGR